MDTLWRRIQHMEYLNIRVNEIMKHFLTQSLNSYGSEIIYNQFVNETMLTWRQLHYFCPSVINKV